MCGIAGFSLTKHSTVNARALSHHLLAEIESRGFMASGFAFGKDGKVGYHKAAVAGSNLRLKGLPRDAKTVILHTRLATHGSIQDNENNHPVLSPDSKIALIHNGVIWNHDEVRYTQLDQFEGTMPEVDTSVIPALIQTQGVEGLRHLSGDAAIAWLSSDHADTLNLARLESSPVAFTQLDDGSIVFASTPYLLDRALERMNLTHGSILQMDDRDYFQLEFGAIVKFDQTPELVSFSTDAWWRSATSGGAGRRTSSAGYSYSKSSPAYDAMWDDDNYDDLPKSAPKDTTAMVFDGGEEDEPFGNDAYYTIDQDGNFKSYRTLDALETDLKWFASIANEHGEPQFGGDGMSRWMEYFLDIGSFGFEADELISWVKDPSEIFYHEDPNSDGLGYIKDGAAILAKIDGN